MDRDQLADAARGGGAGVGRGLHRADVAAHQHGDVAGADVFLADQRDVGGLDHRVGGFDRADEAFGFDQPERFCHAVRTLPPFRRRAQYWLRGERPPPNSALPIGVQPN